MRNRFLFLILVASLSCSCGSKDENDSTKSNTKVIEMKITSSAFQEGNVIPDKFTCNGDDVSPPLEWSGIPEGTKSLALICNDPDAPVGIWTHWIIYNIPPDKTKFDENIHTDKKLPDGSVQGVNDFGNYGYSGPCPPAGYPHRYNFILYALDITLSMKEGMRRGDLEDAINNHVLGRGQLMGKYSRKQ